MITMMEAKAKMAEWAKTHIPESLHYTEIHCVEYPELKIYGAVIYHPDTLDCCCSGMQAPNEDREFEGPVVPHIDMVTGEYVYVPMACA